MIEYFQYNYHIFIYRTLLLYFTLHVLGYVAKPAKATLTPSERGYGPPTGQGVDLNNTEPLYVDTNAEAIP